jgi:hypothetical protein
MRLQARISTLSIAIAILAGMLAVHRLAPSSRGWFAFIPFDLFTFIIGIILTTFAIMVSLAFQKK